MQWNKRYAWTARARRKTLGFDKLKKYLRNIELDATRIDDENYFEAVIKRSGLDGAVRVMNEIFGPPAWPSKDRLSKDVETLIKNFGGLRKGQTLYFLREKNDFVFAMLWPWQDGERVTIKIARVI